MQDQSTPVSAICPVCARQLTRNTGNFGFYHTPGRPDGYWDTVCRRCVDLDMTRCATCGARFPKNSQRWKNDRCDDCARASGDTAPSDLLDNVALRRRLAARPPLAPRNVAGRVYVLHGYADVYKIGRSANVKKRLRGLTKLPFACTVAHSIECDDCAEAERIIHAHFSDRRLNGEWFRLEHADLERLRGVAHLPAFGRINDPRNADTLRLYCRMLALDPQRASRFVLSGWR